MRAAWAARLRAVGHGERTEMSTAEALDIAAQATPQTKSCPIPTIPNGRKPGDKVEVDARRLRQDQRQRRDRRALAAAYRDSPARSAAGEVVVHFPRAGFLVFRRDVTLSNRIAADIRCLDRSLGLMVAGVTPCLLQGFDRS